MPRDCTDPGVVRAGGGGMGIVPRGTKGKEDAETVVCFLGTVALLLFRPGRHLADADCRVPEDLGGGGRLVGLGGLAALPGIGEEIVEGEDLVAVLSERAHEAVGVDVEPAEVGLD